MPRREAISAIGRSLAARAISRSTFISGCLPLVDADFPERMVHGVDRAGHIGWRDRANASHAEGRHWRVIEVADQDAARPPRTEKGLHTLRGARRALQS